MNETVQNLVNAIQSGNASETENSFAAAMADKLGSRLDDLRQTIAQSMFTQPVVEQETTDDANLNNSTEE